MKLVKAYNNYSNINFIIDQIDKKQRTEKKAKFSYTFKEPWTWPIFPILGAKHDFQKIWLNHTQQHMGP